MLDLKAVDKSWTLFLDRDGVVNHEKVDGYILNWKEFRFYEGVPDAVRKLTAIFGRLIMVTNQRGIGKELMTESELGNIHLNMLETLEKAGGRIERIYYCTSLDDAHAFRKPNPGMAFEAKKDFPAIDFSKSIIVGNNFSDMEFGRNAGMHTVFVKTTDPEVKLPNPLIDLWFGSLTDFAKAFEKS